MNGGVSCTELNDEFDCSLLLDRLRYSCSTWQPLHYVTVHVQLQYADCFYVVSMQLIAVMMYTCILMMFAVHCSLWLTWAQSSSSCTPRRCRRGSSSRRRRSSRSCSSWSSSSGSSRSVRSRRARRPSLAGAWRRQGTKRAWRCVEGDTVSYRLPVACIWRHKWLLAFWSTHILNGLGSPTAMPAMLAWTWHPGSRQHPPSCSPITSTALHSNKHDSSNSGFTSTPVI